MNSTDSLRTRLERLQWRALVLGGVSLLACVLFGVGNREQFFHSYLLGYVFWLAIPLGSMAIVMMHSLTGGSWGLPIRRMLEASTRTFPLMAILFVPVATRMKELYGWAARPAELGTDGIMQFKRSYLNPQFFIARAAIYFAIWLLLAYFLNKWSAEQDRSSDPRIETRLEALSGPGLILWGLAVTYSSVDWVMSLEPRWYSTIYGMIFMVIGALAAMAFVIFVLRLLSDEKPIAGAVSPAQFNDLGNLMLAFVMLWAYLSFSQFLIIWAGNLKDEIPWYMTRAFGGWGGLALVLIIFHFGLPFLLLLSRGVKRRLRVLSLVAGMMIVLTLFDVYWIVVPSYQKAGPEVHLLDILAVVGIGGLWVAVFFWQLKRRPILPVPRPGFEGAVQHGD